MDLAGRGRVLPIDGQDPPARALMAGAAREAGAVVTADIDSIYQGLPELLPLIDVLITSAEFPYRLTGIGDERASLLEIKARFGCAIVGATLGARGALIYCEGQFIESPAFEVPGGCRDTTGAGDAFHGGFIYGMLNGADLETGMKLRKALTALKRRALGGRAALPTVDELREFLE